MNWPRGRYNGQRIVGFEMKLRLDVTEWRLKWFGRHGACACLGPLKIWLWPAYEQRGGA